MRKLIVSICFLMSFISTYGQSVSVDIDLKVKTDSIEELNKLDWDGMKEVLEMNSDKELNLVLIYTNSDNKSKVRINNLELNFKLTPTNFEIDKERIKIQIDKLISLSEKYKISSLKVGG
jgi:hypothetical protein